MSSTTAARLASLALAATLAAALLALGLTVAGGASAADDPGPPPPPPIPEKPVVTITSGPEGLTTDSTPTFAFTSDIAGVTFDCVLDQSDDAPEDEAWAPCNEGVLGPGHHVVTQALAEGEWTFWVRATNAGSGGLSTTSDPVEREFTVDVTVPETTIESGPEGPTSQSRPTFTFSADDPQATFECSLDRGTASWGPCSDPDAHTPAAPLDPDSYRFRVRASDSAGNVDGTPATRSFEVADCTITGTNGADELTGTMRADVICSLGGADVVNAVGGNDVLYAGEGNDTLNGGSGPDVLYGEEGEDTLTGKPGIAGNPGNNTLHGGPGNDTLHGSGGDDRMLGEDGHDSFYGSVGEERLEGGPGDDVIKGFDGRDDLRGQAGDDQLDGGPGNDALDGGDGFDLCKGGLGQNTLVDCETERDSCAICADFVTSHDPDGPGPADSRTRLHPGLVANIPYLLDVDGDRAPVPLGVLPIPGYEIKVVVQGASAETPTIRIDKLVTAPLSLPLRVEVVTGFPVRTSFGYDARDASAPRAFVAKIDTSDRDGDAATSQAKVDATITGAPSPLTVLNESFRGDPVGGRTERSIRRATLGDRGTAVPTTVGVELTTSEGHTDLTVTRDIPTTLTFGLVEPDGASTTGTLSDLPARVDFTLAKEDVNADTTPDTRVAYSDSGELVRPDLELAFEEGSKLTTASVVDLPSEITKLTFAEVTEGAEATYDANARAGETRVLVSDADQKTEFEATLAQLPADIGELSWRTPDNHVSVGYSASEETPQATVRAFDGDLPAEDGFPAGEDRTVKAVVTGVPGAFAIDLTPKTQTLDDGTEEERSVTYAASDSVDEVVVTVRGDRPLVEGLIKDEAEDDIALRRRAGAKDLDLTLAQVPPGLCARLPSVEDMEFTAGSNGIDPEAGPVAAGHECDGAAGVGRIELAISSHPQTSPERICDGLDGLLLRDGRLTLGGAGGCTSAQHLELPDNGDAEGMFVAFARIHGLRSFSMAKDDLGFDLGLTAPDAQPVIVDMAREEGLKPVWVPGPQINALNRKATDTTTVQIPDPPPSVTANYRGFPGRLDSFPGGVGNGLQFHYASDPNAPVSDPASGDALTYEQRTQYQGPAVPIEYETQPARDVLPSEYPAGDFSSRTLANLDVLPHQMYLCRAEGKPGFDNNICTEDVFTDAMFDEFSASAASKGSLRITTSPYGPAEDPRLAKLSYLSETVGRETFGLVRSDIFHVPDLEEEDIDGCELNLFDPGEFVTCEDSKPGKAVSRLDDFAAGDFSLQFHSTGEDCCGWAGGWLGGYDEKGYLAIDTGWAAQCEFEDEPFPCPADEPHVPLLDIDHLAPPVTERTTGAIVLEPDLVLPSDDPAAWDWSADGGSDELSPLGQAGGMAFGPLFGADHRVMELDPGNAGIINVIGGILAYTGGWADGLKEDDIASSHGHTYCGDTEWTGALSEIGDFFCRKHEYGEHAP